MITLALDSEFYVAYDLNQCVALPQLRQDRVQVRNRRQRKIDLGKCHIGNRHVSYLANPEL